MELIKRVLYSNLQTMTVEDYNKYLEEERNGYITIRPHQEDKNLVILNYTESVQFEKRWNKETMSARGLILDLTDATDNGIIYILAKPFNKFPNYGENLDYEEDIDVAKIDSVMEKMDGSLGISYFFKGGIRFATRGSFHSEQAVKATELWEKNHAKDFDFGSYKRTPITYLVEIIYPDNRVVVDYGKDEKLVLLGINYLFADYDAIYSDLQCESKLIHMEVARKFDYTIEELLEMKKTLSPNEEGWVVRFLNGKRLKIKGDEYLQVHRIKHGMSEKAKFKAWADGSLLEYIKMLPEEFRPELEEFGDKLDKLKDAQYTLFQAFFEMIKEQSTDKKSFALLTNQLVSQEYRKFMFDAYKNGSVSVQLIRDEIYKGYTEYIEVIKTWNNDL